MPRRGRRSGRDDRGEFRAGQRCVQRPGLRPALVPEPDRRQDPDQAGPVGDLPAVRHGRGLLQRYPRHGQLGLLVLALVPVHMGYLGQVPGQVEPDHLGGEAGRGVDVDQQLPAVRPQVGLLGQLPRGGLGKALAQGVDDPGGDPPHGVPDGVSVLVHHPHPVLLVHGHRPDRADMHDVVPAGALPARHPYLVGEHGEHRPPVPLVPGPHGVTHRLTSVSSTGSRSASAYASAAPTNAANNGCGRVGRLLSSGCAWVATKNGCSSRSSSTNSTNRPSGEVPEIRSPALVRASRYALLTSYRCRCRSDTSGCPYASATIEPATSVAGYAPRRIVPPRSPCPATMSAWSAMVAITGWAAPSSNSRELAPSSPARWRATSMVMHCNPRHRPRIGTPCSRAYRAAPILPSMPRTPNPPGITTPSTPARAWAAPVGLTHSSLGTQRNCTRARCAKPAARTASDTDRYASGRSTYLPTIATVTASLGWCTRSSRSSQALQSTSRNESPSRRTTYASSPSRCSTFGMS